MTSTYQAPKTNWTSVDGVTMDDLNRIEGNIDSINQAGSQFIKGLGFGSASKDMSGTDLNAIDVTGFYQADRSNANTLNAPPRVAGDHNWVYIIAVKSDAYGHKQIAYDFNNVARWERTSTYNGTTAVWGAWAQLATLSDLHAYGLGDVAKDISNTDLNALTATGFYRGDTLTNHPPISSNNPDPTNGWFFIVHIAHTATWQNQIAYELNSGKQYIRTCVDSGGGVAYWNPWVLMATQGTIDKTGLGSTSKNTLPSATDLNTVVNSGVYRLQDQNINAPSGADWGQLVVFRGDSSADTIAQMVYMYNTGQVFKRAGNPSNTGGTGVWSPWAEMQDEFTSSYQQYKSGKDVNGVFTTVQYKRKSNGSLAQQSVLSGGTSPQYTTETVTYYAADGATAVKTDTFALSYDASGALISRV